MPADDRPETSASRRAHDPGRDPRDIVTEHAFRVDPGLLGVPLAGPVRRAGAMLLDLLVLGLLFPFRAAASALLGGSVDLMVALAGAWVLFRLASPSTGRRTPGRGVRALMRTAGVVVALVGLGSFVGDLTGGEGDDGGGPPGREASAGEAVPAEVREELAARGYGEVASEDVDVGAREWTLGELVGGVDDVVALGRATGAGEAQPVADRLALTLQRAGASRTEIREGLRTLIGEVREGEPGWADTVVARAVARADSAARLEHRRADSVLLRYAAALTQGDTARADSLRPRLQEVVAGDRIDALRDRIDELEDRAEAAESTPGFVDRGLTLVTEDLGIGLGWIGIYFTVFIALWDGRTPGKRLLGMQVVNLDGEPMGWWDAFSRFGGYAAGLATGMLGYLQLVWDPNRQALHDRVAGTVVIRTRGPGKRYRRSGE